VTEKGDQVALIECRFYSEVLGEDTSIFAVIPTTTFEDVMKKKKMNFKPGAKFQTLYLLNGIGGDHSGWVRNTSIERYAQRKCLAVVMPAAGRSFYTDAQTGSRFWTFISEELPAVARSLFPLSDKKEDNFAAGASMGAYGAFKLALRKPESFAAAAGISGTADVSQLIAIGRHQPVLKKTLEGVFGNLDSVAGSENDLFFLMKKMKNENTEIPLLYQCRGKDDISYPIQLKSKEFAQAHGIEMTFEDGPGDHSWTYWDASIKRVLDWLPLKNAMV
jgi:S-formylglutathione hydrolase FrmB